MKKTIFTITAAVLTASMLFSYTVFADDLPLDDDGNLTDDCVNISSDQFVEDTNGHNVNGSNCGTINVVSEESVVEVNVGTVNENQGLINENYGSVENHDDGIVNYNYPGATCGGTGTVTNRLDDANCGPNTVINQLWQVVAANGNTDWEKVLPTATAGTYWVKETDQYQVWLLESTGELNLQSRVSGKRIININTTGGGDTASLVPLGNGVWQISGITSIITINGIEIEDIPAPAPEPSSPSVDVNAPYYSSDASTDAPEAIEPVVKRDFFLKLSDTEKQYVISELRDDVIIVPGLSRRNTKQVIFEPVTDTDSYRDMAISELKEIGILNANKLQILKACTVPAMDNKVQEFMIKVPGVKSGDIIWVMYVSNGITSYIPVKILDDGILTTTVQGLFKGGTLVFIR